MRVCVQHTLDRTDRSIVWLNVYVCVCVRVFVSEEELFLWRFAKKTVVPGDKRRVLPEVPPAV